MRRQSDFSVLLKRIRLDYVCYPPWVLFNLVVRPWLYANSDPIGMGWVGADRVGYMCGELGCGDIAR